MSTTVLPPISFFFFFNDTATTEIYTLSLHDALPIYALNACARLEPIAPAPPVTRTVLWRRSEEHTSELQSRLHLVCRLLLEKKKNKQTRDHRSLCIRQTRTTTHTDATITQYRTFVHQ